MKILLAMSDFDNPVRRVHVDGAPFLLGGDRPLPAIVALELPTEYRRGEFSAETVRAFCQRVEHEKGDYHVIPEDRWRPAVLVDYLDADLYPDYLPSREAVRAQFPPSSVRDFLRLNMSRLWEVIDATTGSGGGISASALEESYESVRRLKTVLDLLAAMRDSELEEISFGEEEALVADPRLIPDDRLEQSIMNLRSERARETLGAELLRRSLASEDPTAKFPLLAGATNARWGTPRYLLRQAVDAAVLPERKDPNANTAKPIRLRQNLRNVTLDLTNATTERGDLLTLLFSLRATQITWYPSRLSRRERDLLIVNYERRPVFLQADRSLIRRILRSGGSLTLAGNTLVVRADEVGGMLQEMDRIGTLAYLKPDEVSDLILAREPGLANVRELAMAAQRDHHAGRRLADLAMETLFGIDPDVAAMLLRGRRRFAPA